MFDPIVPKVTTHAMLRWLERVEGMNMRRERRLAELAGCESGNDHSLLLHLCKNGKINFYEVERRILTPEVAAAIRAGETRVVHRGVEMRISCWDVATVFLVDDPSRKSQERRKREGRRQAYKRERGCIRRQRTEQSA